MKQTPRQRAEYHYMMQVMRRLEWDLHHPAAMQFRVPPDWHDIASRAPEGERVKVTLKLDADVVRFLKRMGRGWGPRVNDILTAYMRMRLAGLVKGAEAQDLAEAREGMWDGRRPKVGDWSDDPGEDLQAQVLKLAADLGEIGTRPVFPTFPGKGNR